MNKLTLTLLLAIALAGCGNRESTSTGAGASPSGEDRATEFALAQLRKPSYTMREGLEYGYEPALSVDDKQRGVAGTAVQMYRFLGRVGDRYQVGSGEGQTFVVYEGAAPFDFVKAHVFIGDQLVRQDTMHLQSNAIAALALKDALYGNMQQYRGSRDGKTGHLVFEADAKRITFIVDK